MILGTQENHNHDNLHISLDRMDEKNNIPLRICRMDRLDCNRTVNVPNKVAYEYNSKCPRRGVILRLYHIQVPLKVELAFMH